MGGYFFVIKDISFSAFTIMQDALKNPLSFENEKGMFLFILSYSLSVQRLIALFILLLDVSM